MTPDPRSPEATRHPEDAPHAAAEAERLADLAARVEGTEPGLGAAAFPIPIGRTPMELLSILAELERRMGRQGETLPGSMDRVRTAIIGVTNGLREDRPERTRSAIGQARADAARCLSDLGGGADWEADLVALALNLEQVEALAAAASASDAEGRTLWTRSPGAP